MAPEVIKGKYDRSCDIWSIGIVTYILLCGYPPFNGDTNKEIFDSITRGRFVFPAQAWSNVSDFVKDFITCLLRKDPRSRFTVQEALIHPWIARHTVMHLDSDEAIHYFGLKRKSSKQELIDQVFPKHVSKAFLEGRRLEPDRADMATMIFSDIVGYTKISSILSPEQVSDLLDRLYLKFDELSVKHDVFKIETIGDAFVGICNLVKDQSTDHAKRIVEFAIDCVKAAAETPILCEFPSIGSVRIRVGIHCGPVVARVVGSRNPRYCVFGDTVNTTARMESHSLPMKIHCSDQAAQVLKAQVPGIMLFPRGLVSIKGKGKMETFFVSPNCDQSVSKGDGIIVTRNLKPNRNLKIKNPSAA
jgi:class 3 adenylate cyclase